MPESYINRERRILECDAGLARVRCWLIGAISLLAGTGIVLIYSSSAIKAANFGSPMYFVEKQLAWIGIGLFALMVLSFFNYRKLAYFRWPCLIISILALVLVKLSNIGNTVNGAQRWIKIGSFSFQPSEFIKVLMVVAISGFLLSEKKNLSLKKFILVVAAILSISGLILIEPDFGTAALFAVVMFAMLFAGGAKLLHLTGLSIFIISFAVIYVATRSNYILERINAWLDGGSTGKAYHAFMSIECMTSGGIWGKGPGAGWAKLWYLPEAHTDFIYSVAGQDLGLVCSLAIIFTFAIIVYSGWKIINLVEDRFAALLAFGMTVMIGMQAAFNIAVVTATVPTKGISLPFMSFGGSGFIASMAMAGILVSITKYSYQSQMKLISCDEKKNPWGKLFLSGVFKPEAEENASGV